MVYIVISEDEKSNSVCKIDLRGVLLRASRLWLKASSIKSVNIFVSILLYAFLAIGFSRAAPAPIYYEPGINPYREQASQDGIESVDPYSGILKIRHLDLFLPGNGGLDIKVSRFYDSANIAVLGVGSSLLSAMGNGWTFHFGKLTGSYVCSPEINNSSTRSIFELPDGTQYKFLKAPTGFGHLYISKEGWVADCANAPNGGGLLITSPDGVRYELTVTGVLGIVNPSVFYVKKITDKQGNWLSFDYQIASGKAYVVKCTASDGRLVTFTYAPSEITGTRVSKISANGQTWQYDYTSNGLPLSPFVTAGDFALAKVTRPDGTAWAYDYPLVPPPAGYIGIPAIRFLGKVTRPEGGFTTYTHSYIPIGIGLTNGLAVRITKKTISDKVNPEASWVYRYKYWESVGGSTTIGVSVTDVADPVGGLTTYKHETPYLGVGSPLAWRVGLLVEKLECSGIGVLTCGPLTAKNREQNEWGSQVVSPDLYQTSTGIALYTDLQTHRPLLTKKTVTRDGTAYVTQYQSYDTYGNPAKIIETGNGVARTADLTYYNDPAKWVVGQRDKETTDSLWVTDRNFDANGNVLSLIKNGVSTAFTYHATGDVASMTDANGNRTNFTDYYRSVPRREDQPGGVTIFRTVNATGTLASETNGAGGTTLYTYDGLNRLSGVGPPAGNPATILRFSSGGRDSKKVTRGNFSETTVFDGYGRALETIKRDLGSLAEIRQAYRYDVVGRKVLETYPTTSTLTSSFTLVTGLPHLAYSYDHLGRITQIKHADGNTRQMQYLAANQVNLTNENGKLYNYTYRSFGDPDERQLMSIAAPVAAANMTITRNALDQITNMTQASVTRSMQYDSRGYLTKSYHPETGWVTYGRDAVGNPLSKSVGTAPSVRTINYAYDGRNRLIATTYQNATTPPVSFSYNAVDDIINATRGLIKRTYGYDANRNLKTESLTVDGKIFNLSYLYDGNDAATQVTYPDGQVVNYYPDALGRPTAVSPYVTSIAYHPSGQVVGMTYANGVTSSLAFNTRLWPSQVSVSKSTTGLVNTSYGYDGLGNVTSMADSVAASYNRTLGYDAIDRLVSASGPWGTGSISYDGRGNILSQTYGATYAKTYAYDTANRLASYTGSSAFTYDAWGNTTRSGNTLSYHLYDDASNLYCASCDSVSPLKFEYDASNYRVKKTRSNVVTYSFYAKDGNLMMEYTPSLSDLKQFAYHNKKQVAMRRIVNPALILGQNSHLNPTRFATAIPRKPVEIETGLPSDLIPFIPLLGVAMMASTN